MAAISGAALQLWVSKTNDPTRPYYIWASRLPRSRERRLSTSSAPPVKREWKPATGPHTGSHKQRCIALLIHPSIGVRPGRSSLGLLWGSRLLGQPAPVRNDNHRAEHERLHHSGRPSLFLITSTQDAPFATYEGRLSKHPLKSRGLSILPSRLSKQPMHK